MHFPHSMFLLIFDFCPCGFIWRRPLPQKFGDRAQLLTGLDVQAKKDPSPDCCTLTKSICMMMMMMMMTTMMTMLTMTMKSIWQIPVFARPASSNGLPAFFAKECLAAHNSLFYIVHQAKGCMHHFLALFTANFFKNIFWIFVLRFWDFSKKVLKETCKECVWQSPQTFLFRIFLLFTLHVIQSFSAGITKENNNGLTFPTVLVKTLFFI